MNTTYNSLILQINLVNGDFVHFRFCGASKCSFQ
jgi:hypothetical protein